MSERMNPHFKLSDSDTYARTHAHGTRPGSRAVESFSKSVSNIKSSQVLVQWIRPRSTSLHATTLLPLLYLWSRYKLYTYAESVVKVEMFQIWETWNSSWSIQNDFYCYSYNISGLSCKKLFQSNTEIFIRMWLNDTRQSFFGWTISDSTVCGYCSIYKEAVRGFLFRFTVNTHLWNVRVELETKW